MQNAFIEKIAFLSFEMHIMLSVIIPFWSMNIFNEWIYLHIYLFIYMNIFSYHLLDCIENHYSVLLTVPTGFGHFFDLSPFSPGLWLYLLVCSDNNIQLLVVCKAVYLVLPPPPPYLIWFSNNLKVTQFRIKT